MRTARRAATRPTAEPTAGARIITGWGRRPGTRQAPAQACHPVGGFLQPLPVERAVADRGHQGVADREVVVLAAVPSQAQQVGTGRHGQHRGPGNAEHVSGRPHLQRVRDDHPGEPELAAQQPGDRGRGHRGGKVAGEFGHPQVAGHDGEGAGPDRRLERRQVDQPQLGQAALDGGDGLVGVRAGAAVPGEVLGARGHASALQAGHCRGGVPGHQAGVRAEGPRADGRAVRRAQYVGAWREVEVDPERGQVGADGPVDRLGQRNVVYRAEGSVARVRAAVRVRHAGDVAALLVDRDHWVVSRRRRAQHRGQRTDLVRSRDVLAEQGNSGQAAAERVEHPARRGQSRERRDEDRLGQAAQHGVRRPDVRVLAHPFTAPAIRPLVMRRWTMRKKTRTGSVNRVEEAMIDPQSTVPRP